MKKIKVLYILTIIIYIIYYFSVPIYAVNEEITEYIVANESTEDDNSKIETLDLPTDYFFSYIFMCVAPDGSGEYSVQTVNEKGNMILKIIKFDYESKEFSTINTYNLDKNLNSKKCYCDKNKKNIYVLTYNANKNIEPKLIKYNIESNTFEYNIDYPSIQSIYIGQNFVVDNNSNLYVVFEDSSTDIKTYNLKIIDKNNKELSSFQLSKAFYPTCISPDGRILFLTDSKTEGLLAIDNGVIKSEKLQTLSSTPGYEDVADYKFIEDDYVLDSYGELARMSINEQNQVVSNIEYRMNSKMDIDCMHQEGIYYYMALDSGLIVKYNSVTKQIEKSYETSKPDKCWSLGFKNNKIYFKYKVYNDYFLLTISEDDMHTSQKFIHTSNTASSHTKEEIIKKYNESAIQADENIYKTQPSKVAPYSAGELTDLAKQDTINQLNFYRWLYGINTIPINEEGLERNQKGAVLMAATDQFTHHPTQPADMDQEFYDEAHKGCSTQKGYTTNIATKTSSVAEAVYQWVDDSTNVLTGSIGHRESTLSLNATSASFGYCDRYATLSMHKDNSKLVLDENSDSFYAYPTPGYFPVEAIGTKSYWSITFPAKDYSFNGSRLKLKVGDVENYVSGEVSTGFGYITTYFMITSDIAYEIVNGNSLKNGKSIEVDLTGVYDKYGNEHEYKYTINLFSINEVKANFVMYAITTGKTTKTSWSRMDSTTLDVGYTGYLRSKIDPDNSTEQDVEVTILNNDNNIIDYDENTGKITTNKNGTVYIKMTVGSAYVSFMLKVGTGTDPQTIEATEVKLNNTSLELGVGQSKNLIATVLPENTQVKEVEYWFSTDNNIVKVENGKVTGIKEGTAKVGVKSYNGKIAYCMVNVVAKSTMLKGDVNEDGDVDLIDCALLLRHAKGIEILDNEQSKRADINEDGDVDLIDYAILLRHVKGIETFE